MLATASPFFNLNGNFIPILMSATDIGKIKMRKIIWATLIGTALVTFTFNAAQAADLKPGEGFYISSSFGATLPGANTENYIEEFFDPDDFTTGFSVGAAVGYDFGQFRIEGELSHRTADVDVPDIVYDANVSASSLMANAWYDVDTGTRFTPYIGGGLGVAMVTDEGTVKSSVDGPQPFSNSDTVLAYQFGAGVDYSLTETIVLGLGYRYLATDDIGESGNYADFHSIDATVRVALTVQPVQAADLKPGKGFYVSGSVGAVFPHAIGKDATVYNRPEKSEIGYSIGIAGGYDFGVIRIEQELSRRSTALEYEFLYEAFPEQNKTARVDLSALSLMANAWYDIDTGTRFTPYIGGGLGVARVSIAAIENVSGIDGSISTQTVFAYQVGVGVDYSVTENITIGLGYRYLGVGLGYRFLASETKVADGFQNINIGMRYTF